MKTHNCRRRNKQVPPDKPQQIRIFAPVAYLQSLRGPMLFETTSLFIQNLVV
jgi:hypothetical protein